MMSSSLSRPSIHNLRSRPDPGDKNVSKSPRLPTRQAHKHQAEYSSEEESLDDMVVAEDLESEDENNSARTRHKKSKDIRKAKPKLYPDLQDELDNNLDENNEYNMKNIRKRAAKKDDNRMSPRDAVTKERRFGDENRKRKKEQEQSRGSIKNFAIILVLGFLVILVYSFSNAEVTINEKNHVIDKFQLFKKEYKHLKKQFPAQTDRFWNVIAAPIRRILTEESPTYPAILLLGVPENQANTGACFTKKIVRIINSIEKVSGDFYIDTRSLNGLSPDRTKLDLDNRMHVALNRSKSVVLDYIENLPAEAALLLHAFCDGDNAPYKNAVIFLVLHSTDEFQGIETRQDDQVENILINLWKAQLGEDEMPALQSRIANNIAILKPESNEICT